MPGCVEKYSIALGKTIRNPIISAPKNNRKPHHKRRATDFHLFSCGKALNKIITLKIKIIIKVIKVTSISKPGTNSKSVKTISQSVIDANR